MNKGLEALNNIAVYSAIHNHLLDGSVKEIKEELDKPQDLYDLIKQKRDKAKLNSDEEAAKGKYDYNCYTCIAYDNQVKAYNDILSLMESMFEVK